MILVIDNYDSFTYNLVQYLGELGEDLRVFRNDKITLEEIEALKPVAYRDFPGPGAPADAGITEEVVQSLPQNRFRFSACVSAIRRSAKSLAERSCARPR